MAVILRGPATSAVTKPAAMGLEGTAERTALDGRGYDGIGPDVGGDADAS